jgi:hypothetical protein
MKGGEGFTKRPRRLPKPKPKEPIRREGVRPGKTSYEKVEVGRTEPEPVAPPSTEGGAPPTPSPEPFHWSPFQIVAVVIAGAALVFAVFSTDFFGLFSPETPQQSSPPPSAQEGGVTQPVAVVEHWVSATPGKGLKIWHKSVDNPPSGDWYEYDIDMRLEGTTLTVGVTYTNTNLNNKAGIGESGIRTIKGVKDDGTTIEFTYGGEEGGTIATVQLTRTADGHLIGSVYETPDINGNYFEGTYDLVSVP